jgi:hypothetical protein
MKTAAVSKVGRPPVERAFGYLFVCVMTLLAIVIVRLRVSEAPLALFALGAVGSMSWLAAFVHTLQAWREPEAGRFGKWPFGGVVCLFALVVIGVITFFALTAEE